MDARNRVRALIPILVLFCLRAQSWTFTAIVNYTGVPVGGASYNIYASGYPCPIHSGTYALIYTFSLPAGSGTASHAVSAGGTLNSTIGDTSYSGCGGTFDSPCINVTDGQTATFGVSYLTCTNGGSSSSPQYYITCQACVTNNTIYAQWYQVTYQATDSSGLYSNNRWVQVQPFATYCDCIASGHPFTWSFQAADCNGCPGFGATQSSGGSGGPTGGSPPGTDPCFNCGTNNLPAPPNNPVTNAYPPVVTGDTNIVAAIYTEGSAIIKALADYQAQNHSDQTINGGVEAGMSTKLSSISASDASTAASTSSSATSDSAIAGNTAAIASNTQVATNQLGAIQANTYAAAGNGATLTNQMAIEIGASYALSNLASGTLNLVSNFSSDMHQELTQLTNEVPQSGTNTAQSISAAIGTNTSQSVSNTLVISNLLSQISSSLGGGGGGALTRSNVFVAGDWWQTNTSPYTNYSAGTGATWTAQGLPYFGGAWTNWQYLTNAMGAQPTNGTGTRTWLYVSLPNGMGGTTNLSMDPEDWWPGVPALLRLLLGWAAAMFFGWWVSSELRELVHVYATAQLGGVPDMDSDIPVLGNFIGLGVALLVPISFILLWVSAFVYFFSATISVVAGHWADSPFSAIEGFSGYGSAAIYVLNEVMPMPLLLALMWARMTIPAVLGMLVAAGSTVSRWLFGK